jgi:ribonuclease R
VITADEIRRYMLEKSYRPMLRDELCDAFGVEPSERPFVEELLAHMQEDGQVLLTRTRRYGVPERMDLMAGRIAVKSRGFGFVMPLYEDRADVYVPAPSLGGAMDGDTVLVRARPNGERHEGEVVRVLKRAHTTMVGTVRAHGEFAIVTPDDRNLGCDAVVSAADLAGAVDGQKVVVEFIGYPDGVGESASGRVREVLGFASEPGVDILSIMRKYGLSESFSAAVRVEADGVPDEVQPAEIAKRRDLRSQVTMTIDGADAKDLDDAVSVQRRDNGNIVLCVHIADVSHYVTEGSALDREAYERGTSVYLVDRVIPMLPTRLSNGICSLHPRVDRLTLTCEMEWSPAAERVRHDIFPSVIRTSARLTYDGVRKALAGDGPVDADTAAMLPHLQLLRELALALRDRRMARGAVDFDFAEVKIRVDEAGKPLELQPRTRTIAEMIIEECMIAANETVAEHMYRQEIPLLYRIHEPPTAEKMQALQEFVHNFGYHLKSPANVSPASLQALLAAVRGRKEEMVVSHVLLRSLRQARYAAQEPGHFGLAAEFYTHFTSPIRRYPDLVVHRIVREWFEGRMTPARVRSLGATLPDVAAHCSHQERNAVEAERETELLKKIEYMLDKVGQEFDGTISGVTGFGFFVELDNLVEGLVHISYLGDDYYHYHEKLHALVGERLRKSFRVGDRVRVRMGAASKERMTIDFELCSKLSEDDPSIVRMADLDPRSVRGKGADRGSGHRPIRVAKAGGAKTASTVPFVRPAVAPVRPGADQRRTRRKGAAATERQRTPRNRGKSVAAAKLRTDDVAVDGRRPHGRPETGKPTAKTASAPGKKRAHQTAAAAQESLLPARGGYSARVESVSDNMELRPVGPPPRRRKPGRKGAPST